jgi:hypothetical protein
MLAVDSHGVIDPSDHRRTRRPPTMEANPFLPPTACACLI